MAGKSIRGLVSALMKMRDQFNKQVRESSHAKHKEKCHE